MDSTSYGSNRRSTLVKALPVALLFVSAAACTTGPTAALETERPPATHAGTAFASAHAATPVATSSPTASAPLARPIASPGMDSDPLAAGRWRTQKLHTPVEFSVSNSEWIAVADSQRFAFLTRPNVGPNGLVFVWVQNVFMEPCERGWDGGTMPWPAENGPAEYFAWLNDESPVDFGSAEPATVAGLPALSIERVIPNAAFDGCANDYFPMVDVAVEPPGDIGLPRYGQRFTLTAVDVDDLTALILAFADAQAFDAHRAAVDELLASLTFETSSI